MPHGAVYSMDNSIFFHTICSAKNLVDLDLDNGHVPVNNAHHIRRNLLVHRRLYLPCFLSTMSDLRYLVRTIFDTTACGE